MEITKNQAAFATITVAALATGASVMAGVAATTVATKVAYIALGVLMGTANLAAITSYFSVDDSQTASEYFDKFKNHLQVGVPAVLSTISQALLTAIIQGVVDGVSTAIRRAIAGPDVVIKNTQ